MKRLSEVLPGLYIREEGEGYPAPGDPKLIRGKPDGQKRFVDKHRVGEGNRGTDVDDSTKDDKLFKAVNIKRAVPKDGDTHGHTPVGADDKVYESVMSKIFGSQSLQELSAGNRNERYGDRDPMHKALLSHGWERESWGSDHAGYVHPEHEGHEIGIDRETGTWEHRENTNTDLYGDKVKSGKSHTSLTKHLKQFHRGAK